MKRPAWQHYPGDWVRNQKLRLCGWAARGAWLEVLGLMHNGDEYGVLRVTLREIANAVGAPLPLIKELASKGVMKGDDAELTKPYIYTPSHGGKKGPPVTLVPAQKGPIWFSSRMVRDEYLRKIRGGETRFTNGPYDLSTASPKDIPKSQPIPTNGARSGGESAYGAAVAVAFALDTSVEVCTSEVGHPSPPGDTRLNGKPPDIPRAWRASEAATKAAAAALGMEAGKGEGWDAFRDRIAKAIDHAKRAHH